MRIIPIPSHRRHPLAIVMAVLVLAACGRPDSDGRAAGDRVQVVASVYPLAEVARHVGGDRVEVADLTPPGVEPHDLELDSDQVDAIQDADVVLYLSGGIQPAVEAAVKNAGGETFDILANLNTGDDPHVWLDPTLMERVVDVTQEALAQAEPGGAETFSQNADAYRSELKALDAEYQAGLAQCQRRVIVTSHDAFAHLAERYQLTVEPISGLSPEAEPDPRRVAELADLVRREGSTTVFTESLVPPEVAETLAREAGVRTAVLDPLEGLGEDQLSAGERYITVMQENLKTLREALGCP